MRLQLDQASHGGNSRLRWRSMLTHSAGSGIRAAGGSRGGCGLYDPGRVAGQARGHNEPHERGVPQERAAVRPSHAELRPVDLHTRWFTLLLPLLPRSRQAPLGAWGTSAPGAVPARRPAAPGAANTTRAGAGAARREPGARAKRSGRAACSGGALMRFVRRRAVLERVRGVHQRVRPPSRPYLVWLSVAWYLVCTRFFITPSLYRSPLPFPLPSQA